MNHYMTGAWVARSQALQKELQQMVDAPGLFKPWSVGLTLFRFEEAQAQVRYRLMIGGT